MSGDVKSLRLIAGHLTMTLYCMLNVYSVNRGHLVESNGWRWELFIKKPVMLIARASNHGRVFGCDSYLKEIGKGISCRRVMLTGVEHGYARKK